MTATGLLLEFSTVTICGGGAAVVAAGTQRLSLTGDAESVAAAVAGGLMISGYAWLVVSSPLSYTITFTVYGPAELVAGVPESVPPGDILKPPGRPVAVKLSVPLPPVAITVVAVYRLPAVPLGMVAGAAIVSGETTVRL